VTENAVQIEEVKRDSTPESEAEAAKNLRVLIVAPAAPLVGGQAVQASRLIERLGAEDNLKIGFLPINPQLPGVFHKLQEIKYLRTIFTSAVYLFKLFAAVPAYDIIHIFSAGDSSFLLAPTPAVLIARLFGKKTILNYRHGGAESHLRKWKRTAPPTIRLFDKIVVPSGFLVEVFAKFGLEAQPIFNFVDTAKYRFRERQPLRPVYLSNRNFEALYNVACVLRAFEGIQKKYPEAKLTIAGDGEERPKLENLAKELNLKNVEFTGSVSSGEMPALYDSADFYLNSPNVDNMPNSIIEAYACGLPVISTGVGGIPFILKDEEMGLLVEKGDCDALARGALRLLEDDELAQKIIANAHRECVKYSWENVREKWLELYRQLA
jgi:glycosyltransferase involved in cell wall biosynthesis